ncbi:MAG: hypothetical protein KZQ94_18855 [Candidatus Thiodiazotropha sp. (ex Troendleina suluensis)]|nr:hypothetical protein [Candidatus Thiodiazotropha sp. (ex Troendleina suluensis)]
MYLLDLSQAISLVFLASNAMGAELLSGFKEILQRVAEMGIEYSQGYVMPTIGGILNHCGLRCLPLVEMTLNSKILTYESSPTHLSLFTDIS